VSPALDVFDLFSHGLRERDRTGEDSQEVLLVEGLLFVVSLNERCRDSMLNLGTVPALSGTR
jgi:hypothetical protein